MNTKLESKKLIELINNTDQYNARSYSGRGMYGKSCVGVSTSDVYELISELLDYTLYNEDRDTLEDVISFIKNTSEDSLGRGMIVYWRSMVWPDDMQDSEDSEENDND